MALSKYTLPVRKNILSAIFSCIVASGIPCFEAKYPAQLINYRKSDSWNWKANGDQHSGRIKCSSSGPELSMHGLLLVCLCFSTSVSVLAVWNLLCEPVKCLQVSLCECAKRLIF